MTKKLVTFVLRAAVSTLGAASHVTFAAESAGLLFAPFPNPGGSLRSATRPRVTPCTHATRVVR